LYFNSASQECGAEFVRYGRETKFYLLEQRQMKNKPKLTFVFMYVGVIALKQTNINSAAYFYEVDLK